MLDTFSNRISSFFVSPTSLFSCFGTEGGTRRFESPPPRRESLAGRLQVAAGVSDFTAEVQGSGKGLKLRIHLSTFDPIVLEHLGSTPAELMTTGTISKLTDEKRAPPGSNRPLISGHPFSHAGPAVHPSEMDEIGILCRPVARG